MNRVNSDLTTANGIDGSVLMSGSPNLGWLLTKSLLKSGNYQVGDSLPCLKTHQENLLIDRSHLNHYNQLCGFDTQKISPTYLWVICFPLIMNILLSKQFPLRAMGQVHLRNRISLHEPVDLHSPINIYASVGSSELTFRGLEWNIDLSVTAQDRLLWSSQSTFLYRCKTDIERQPLKDKSSPLASICNWSISEQIGRQYATVSGDYNPIHLSALTAKLFGFKRAIAHGMWSKARCLVELDQHIPDAGYTVDVNFRCPVFLPSKVCLSAQQSQDSHRFSLCNLSGSQIHLDGTIF
jgi:hypothetical protein